MHGNAAILWSQLQGLLGSLSPAGQATVNGLQGQIATNPQGVITALWAVAIQEIRNPAVLRSLLAVARPAMSGMAIGWANANITCVALTGMTVGAVVSEIAFYICVAALVIALILIVLFLVKLAVSFFHWMVTWNPGARSPRPPMQQPDWSRLWNALNSSAIGPRYCIEDRCRPSAIQA